MRALPLLTALLVALLPLALAQGDDSGSQSSTSSSSAPPPPSTAPCANESTPQGHDACMQRFCSQHPGAPDCPSKPPQSNSTSSSGPPAGCDTTTQEGKRACIQQYCSTHPDAQVCRQGPPPGNTTGNGSRPPPEPKFCQEAEGGDQVRCEHAINETERTKEGFDDVSFTVDRPNGTLNDYRIDGLSAIRSVQLDTGSDTFTYERFGGGLRLGDNDTELAIHDDPTGLLRFKGDDGSLTLTFYDDAQVETIMEGARVTYPSGDVGLINGQNLTWMGNHTLVIRGFGSFLLPPRGDDGQQPPMAVEAKERVAEAVERRLVGAEINLKAPKPGEDPTADANATPVKVLAYDDVNVKVDEDALADHSQPIRIELSANLSQGRTFVVKLDKSLLASGDPKDLLLHYYDLHNLTNGSVEQTEVVFHQASSLEDVLDPTDDAGQPEYWVVSDANGLELMFSVPHWSAHALTIESLGLDLPPNVAYGIIGGAVVTVLAGVLMLVPRRREEL